MQHPITVATSIYGNVTLPGDLKVVGLLEALKRLNENILVDVKRGEQTLIIPIRSLDLEAVTLVHG